MGAEQVAALAIGRLGVSLWPFVARSAVMNGICHPRTVLPTSGPAADGTGAPAACYALTATVDARNGRALAAVLAGYLLAYSGKRDWDET
jgi:hypothetical protein